MRFFLSFLCAAVFLFSVGSTVPVYGQEDFGHYVRTSEDFRRVDLEPALRVSERWDRWVLMPWRYDWGREYDRSLALELKGAGFNGAFCDYGPETAVIHEQAGLLSISISCPRRHLPAIKPDVRGNVTSGRAIRVHRALNERGENQGLSMKSPT